MRRPEDPSAAEERERLLGDCIDRLNRGESVDPDRMIREHPELGEEFVEQVEAFRGIGKREDAVPLGKFGDYRLLPLVEVLLRRDRERANRRQRGN